MSLQHALLVSLSEREASGYDLTRRFDRSLGFFWSATHQQIYRVLATMAEDGLVATRVEPGEGKPDRRVYTVTDAGRAELLAWTRRETPPEKTRSEFAVKVRGMHHGDPAAVIEDIRRRRDEHATQLAYYESDCARHYPHPDRLEGSARALYAVLRGGIHTERAMLAWCDEMLTLLDGSDAPGISGPATTETLGSSCVQMHPGAFARRVQGRGGGAADATSRDAAPTTSNETTPEHGRTR